MKTCTVCKIEMDIENFYMKGLYRDSRCKFCKRKANSKLLSLSDTVTNNIKALSAIKNIKVVIRKDLRISDIERISEQLDISYMYLITAKLKQPITNKAKCKCCNRLYTLSEDYFYRDKRNSFKKKCIQCYLINNTITNRTNKTNKIVAKQLSLSVKDLTPELIKLQRKKIYVKHIINNTKNS
jgi:hypothetical protein